LMHIHIQEKGRKHSQYQLNHNSLKIIDLCGPFTPFFDLKG